MLGRIGIVAVFVFTSLLGPPGAGDGYGQGAPKFPRDSVTIVTGADVRHRFTVEIARTEEQRSWGLMYRRELASDHGMLFIYPRVRRVSMWMKNTFIPLDMIFIGRKGRIRHIHRDAEPESRRTISSNAPIRAVLEVRAGTADRLDLETGDRVHHSVFGNTD